MSTIVPNYRSRQVADGHFVNAPIGADGRDKFGRLALGFWRTYLHQNHLYRIGGHPMCPL